MKSNIQGNIMGVFKYSMIILLLLMSSYIFMNFTTDKNSGDFC